jgi:hypothetical protein
MDPDPGDPKTCPNADPANPGFCYTEINKSKIKDINTWKAVFALKNSDLDLEMNSKYLDQRLNVGSLHGKNLKPDLVDVEPVSPAHEEPRILHHLVRPSPFQTMRSLTHRK